MPVTFVRAISWFLAPIGEGFKMSLVSDCLRKIESVRQQFRGQPKEIRPRYRQLTEEMLKAFTQMSTQEREGLSSAISRDESGLLLGISRSAATASVAENDADRLYWGLLALVMENQKQDYRETLMELTLLDNSARKLGLQLEEVFEQVKEYALEATSELFETYFREGSRHLSAMGYVESVDKNGRFTYERTW